MNFVHHNWEKIYMIENKKKKRGKKKWIIFAFLLIIITFFLNQPEFGKLPSGDDLKYIKESPNYKTGKFHNQIETKNFNSERSFFRNIYEMLTMRNPNSKPNIIIPTQKTILKDLDKDENIIVWLGHSSLYIQLNGKKILVDPVLSTYASPLSFLNKAFEGTNLYTVDEIPDIDVLLITHDHWDHLDYNTIKGLKDRIELVICPLGVGSHLKHWKYNSQKIKEVDWDDTLMLGSLKLYALPARHFSGRSIRPNKSLWASYLLESNDTKIFISGDTGYGPHFREIGKKFGKIDLAIIENGQYNTNGWPDIHIWPEQTIMAAKELNAKEVLPVHNSKFDLSKHDWYEPNEKLSELMENEEAKLLTPMIGEVLKIKGKNVFKKWWILGD